MRNAAPSYLLDTDWVIHFFAGAEPYRRRIRELGPNDAGISVITEAELYEGVYFGRQPEESARRLDEFFARVTTVPLTRAIAQAFGRERGRLRRDGMLIGDFDLLIGCTARELAIPLCTNNRRHFERIDGLELISQD